MRPTNELRTRLRKLLGERVPVDGSVADTRFTDDDLDELLVDATNVFGAASMGWTMKAAMLQSEMGDVERFTAGQETEDLAPLRDRLKYALSMADRYAATSKAQGVGSVLLRVKLPEVL